MELVIFLIPFIVAIFLLCFYRKQTVWWEYIVLIVPSLLVSFLLKFAMTSYEMSSTEYLGNYVTTITHYDDWDEWIVKRCTRSVPCGRNSKGQTRYRTESYDCSYRKYHDQEWIMTDDLKNEIEITYDEYNRIKKLWQTPEIFKDMNRRYYRKDGDAQYHTWNNREETVRTITRPHRYDNKIKVSRSVFNFENIDDDDVKKYGLFDYPEIVNHDQIPILGYKNVTPLDIKKIQYINGTMGKKYQFRLYMLFFYNKDVSVSMKQQAYWVGGNKNEFVVCVGVDSLTRKTQWVNVFSWADSPSLEVHSEQFIRETDKIDIPKYCDWLKTRIPREWKRKEFKDFDYLEVELSNTQYVWILILTLIYNIGISIFLVRNDFRND